MSFDKVEYQRQYRQKNVERIRAYNRSWAKLNADKLKAARTRHYQAHREEIRTKNRLYMRKRRAMLGATTSEP